MQTVRDLAKNPILIGLVLGLVFNLFSLPIPAPISETIALLSRAALPGALIVLGASLSTYKLAGHVSQVWTIVALKTVLQPMLVWVLAFWVFDLELLWGMIAVIVAGLPVGINAYLFADKYEVCIAPVATGVLLSTIISVGSLSFMLYVFL